MGDFNSLFPNFLNQCLSLKTLLTPVAFVLLTSGLMAAIIASQHNGAAQLHALGRIIVFVILLVFLPTWGNQIVVIVGDTVTNVLHVDPAKIHDEYQAALQLKKSVDGNQSWWEKLIHFPNILEGLVSGVFLLLGWFASAIEWWAYILQTAILFIGYSLSPIFIGMLSFPSLQGIGRNYLFNLLGIMLWPLGWGVAGLVTQGMIDFMTDQSFLSSPSVGGTLNYSLQNLMGLAFLGVWIIFSTIAAPLIIQKAIATGSSVGSNLFSGAYSAGRAGSMAGIMGFASAVGGKSISFGKDSLGGKGLKSAATFGGTAAMAGVTAAATALETLVSSSLNEGHGGGSLIGSLAQMNGASQRQASNKKPKDSQKGFPQSDPSGDQTVANLIKQSQHPDI